MRGLLEQYKKYLPYILFAFLILIAITPAVYFYGKYINAQKILGSQSNGPQDELSRVTEAVGKLIELPQGETPTLATVTDEEKIKNQPLFAKAKNGDKVLIYPESKKAIIYRPSSGKLVEVAPVNISSPSATPVTSPEPDKETPYSFILYNGTDTVGLTRTYEKTLLEKLPKAQVVDRDNASKSDYQKSVLIDIKGDKKDQAQALAAYLNLTAEPLPSGETASKSADFLIILGTDNQ